MLGFCVIARFGRPLPPAPLGGGRAGWAVMPDGEVGSPMGPCDEIEDFRSLISGKSKTDQALSIPKFVNKIDEVPIIDLPPQHPMHVVVSLADRALVGQFTRLWPSPKTMDNWIQKNWRPLISNSVTCYAVGRGFSFSNLLLKNTEI